METETNRENESFGVRAKSPRRIRHEAQAKVFEGNAGTLEDVRKRLGLRPSQICEILRVHPSAWTRWTKGGQQAPPHVYQMLEWYMELLSWRGQKAFVKEGEIYPGETPQIQKLAQEDPLVYSKHGSKHGPNGQDLDREAGRKPSDINLYLRLGIMLLGIQILTSILFVLYIFTRK